jgi:hypothetical protein
MSLSEIVPFWGCSSQNAVTGLELPPQYGIHLWPLWKWSFAELCPSRRIEDTEVPEE